MKNLSITVLFFFILAGIMGTAFADQKQFVGQWQCRMSYMGETGPEKRVSFDSSGAAIIGNQQFSYTVLSPNILRLQSQTGNNDYQYEFSDGNLFLRYQDGSSFQCRKSSSMGQSNGNSGQAAGGSGKEWQLKGTFCNWSGSSSSYSSTSSSSTRRISFDGRGHWTFGSESSFSSSAGMAYGSQGNQDGGTYRVVGNQIQYMTTAGEQGVAQVYVRQNNGRVTEIKINGRLYATELCQ